MIDIRVAETEDHRWVLLVNGVEIGSSKSRFDADFSVMQLRKALNQQQVAKTPSILTAADFDRICLESIICEGGTAYIVEKLVEHFNALDALQDIGEPDTRKEL
jgi:hypothetical protein